MHWNDKINFWYEREEITQSDAPPQPSINDCGKGADYLISQQIDEEGEGQEGNEEINMPGLLAYQDFILDSPAYEWLLANLRRETLLVQADPNSMLAIRLEIIGSLPPSHIVSRKRSAQAYKITFDISWDPLAFVREQNYGEEPEEAIEKVITLTGSARDAQALTCGQYLCQTWPSTGEYAIRLVKDAVRGLGHRHTCEFSGLMWSWFGH
jgi:hypothetical protein